MEIHPPYLIFLGDAMDALAAKTGQGIVDWRPEWAFGQLRLPGCRADLGIPNMSIDEAVAGGAKTFVIGTVSPGGQIPAEWSDTIVSALKRGMDVASGLHTPLKSIEAIRTAAQRYNCRLLDVRHTDRKFNTGTGIKRSGKRLLTVGTDCSVGKKYTALCIERDLRSLGVAADFRATGQTGIFISGRGIALDAVVADFVAGAAEWLTPAANQDHWDIVEGQGSLFHPAFAGVSMGLLHGTQPDAFVVCHETTRKTMRRVDVPMPSMEEVIDFTVRAGRVTNPAIRCVGVAINTQHLEEAEAKCALKDAEDRFSLPATDPIRFGVRVISQFLLADRH